MKINDDMFHGLCHKNHKNGGHHNGDRSPEPDRDDQHCGVHLPHGVRNTNHRQLDQNFGAYSLLASRMADPMAYLTSGRSKGKK